MVDISADDYNVSDAGLVEFVDGDDAVTTTIAAGLWVMISTVEDGKTDKKTKSVVGFAVEADNAQ